MLTRAQIYKKFGISPSTFVEVSVLLESKPKSQHGNVFYDLTKNDKIMLECAQNHGASFKTDGRAVVHLLPFHRFLCLRFLTTPLDDVMDELRYRNLVTQRFKYEYLKKVHGRFISRIPKALRAIARKKAPPTRELEPQYRLMLRVLGIEMPYDNPLWIEIMFESVSDRRLKQLTETVFTTRGDKKDQQATLAELTGYRWKDVGVDVYRSLFYDLYAMDDSDWDYYTGFLAPPERKAKKRAYRMSTNELRVFEGVRPNFEAAMEIVQLNLQKLVQTTYDIGLGGDTKKLSQLISMLKSVGVARGEELDAGGRGGTFFETVKLIPKPRKVRTLEDIKDSKVAKVGHARS